MIRISILTIGDEICIGQIVNTNASWIANECTKAGCQVTNHTSIRDVKESIFAQLDKLSPDSNVILITGGLGPTHDDITKPALCEYFNDELVLNNETYQYLEEFFNKRGWVLTERNKAQAMLPSKCKILPNRAGTAPGMQFEKDGKYFISLPGVPQEMKYIMQNSVLPFLQNMVSENKSEVVLYKNLMTAGIPESRLADLIGEPEEFLNGGSLAFLPSYRGVRLRIGVSAENFEAGSQKIDTIERIIGDRAGKFIYGTDDDTLASRIGEMLKIQAKTVSVAESCTGGLLGAAFTDISGSSDYFIGGTIVYSNEAKINVLGVDKKTIDEFGAVSKETALEMSSKVREKFNTDFGISTTGIAGPTGGTEDKPVGTVWIGLASKDKTDAQRFIFGNDRGMNRERAVGAALTMLWERLKG
jgi:nicotinamide-nucleotide amidase